MLALHLIRSDDGSVTTYVIPMLGQYLNDKPVLVGPCRVVSPPSAALVCGRTLNQRRLKSWYLLISPGDLNIVHTLTQYWLNIVLARGLD